ncbi:MAG TPA: ribonuclease E activity regulator RraA [Trebonia sp.]
MTPAKETAPSTASLSDAHGDAAQSCGGFTQYGGRRRFAGRAATIRCHEDSRLISAALAEPGEGRVLAVDGGGSLRRALLGQALAALAVNNGWAGVVVNGAVRDTGTLARIDLGVAALAACPGRGGHAGAGERDVDLEIRGARISPRSYLVADEDGVLCLPEPPAAAGTATLAAAVSGQAQRTHDHPYRAAVAAGGLVHVSGALGVGPDGVAVAGRREALTAAMDRLAERLATAGAGLGDLVKCTYYVTDVSLRDEANDQYLALFPNQPPARTFVEVAGLPYGAIVEIDALALARTGAG